MVVVVKHHTPQSTDQYIYIVHIDDWIPVRFLGRYVTTKSEICYSITNSGHEMFKNKMHNTQVDISNLNSDADYFLGSKHAGRSQNQLRRKRAEEQTKL